MAGALVIERGTPDSPMELFGRNLKPRARGGIHSRARALRAALRASTQSLGRTRQILSPLYDLSEAFYRLFLDEDLQYSCAYFTDPGMSLEAAQAAKKAHIAAKLDLQPGAHILDIGCGWGGLALMLARSADVYVTGITLSTEQLRVARDRASAAGVSDRVRFALADYRQVAGRFDRIVSVGMFEHVGAKH